MNAGSVFFDTNILLYCFDEAELVKRPAAHELVLQHCLMGHGVISYQVNQEFANVAIRRIRGKMDVQRRLEGLTFLAMGMHVVHSSEKIFNRAIGLWDRYSLSWYDALTVSAAIEGDCGILYTEDMQHGLEIDGMRIVNPFL